MLAWLNRGRRAADAFGVLLFTTLFIVFIVQVVARFGFGKPLPWTDEAAVCLYVWTILWAAATIVPEREHVAFDLVWNLLGRRGRQGMRIAGHLMIAGLCAWALPGVWDYLRFMSREGTPVLGISLFLVYLPFAVLLLALVLRSAVAIVRAAHGLDLDDAEVPRA